MSRLETILASLPESVDWPEPSRHLATRVGARIRSRRLTTRPPRWAVAAVVALVLVVIGVLPGPRQAVADFLEQAGVRIGFFDTTAVDATDLDLGDPVTLDMASGEVGFPLSAPTVLDPPTEIYLDGGAAIMVWEGPILLSQRSSDEPFAEKGLGTGTDAAPVDVEGVPGLWIDGAEHSFTLLDPAGEPIEETTRLAANVLLWSADGIDYRLELTEGPTRALEIAGSLEEMGP